MLRRLTETAVQDGQKLHERRATTTETPSIKAITHKLSKPTGPHLELGNLPSKSDNPSLNTVASVSHTHHEDSTSSQHENIDLNSSENDNEYRASFEVSKDENELDLVQMTATKLAIASIDTNAPNIDIINDDAQDDGIQIVGYDEYNPNNNNVDRSQSIDRNESSAVNSDTKCNNRGRIDINDNNNEKSDCHLQLVLIFYYLLRFCAIFATLFLALIAVLYAISNLIELSAVNLFCNDYTLEEVREYYRDNEISEGKDGTCWQVHNRQLDREVVIGLDINIFEASYGSLNFVSGINFVLFSICALLLVYIAIYHGYYTIYDCYYQIIGVKNPRIQKHLRKLRKKLKKSQIRKNKNNTKNNNNNNNNRGKKTRKSKKNFNCCTTISDKYDAIKDKYKDFKNDWIEPIFYIDSKWRIFRMIGTEIIEMIVQCYLLFIYAGYNIFDPDMLILAAQPFALRRLAVFIGM